MMKPNKSFSSMSTTIYWSTLYQQPHLWLSCLPFSKWLLRYVHKKIYMYSNSKQRCVLTKWFSFEIFRLHHFNSPLASRKMERKFISTPIAMGSCNFVENGWLTWFFSPFCTFQYFWLVTIYFHIWTEMVMFR